MSTPNPTPSKPVASLNPPPASPPIVDPPGMMPSNSTNASLIGGAVATLLMYILGQKGITFPAGAEAALAVLVTAVAGYFPKSGRQ